MDGKNYDKELLIIKNYIQMDRYKQAMEHLALAFQESPNDAQLLYLEAICLYYLERYEEASNSCRAAVRNGYNLVDCYFVLSMVTLQLEDEREAEKVLLSALTLSPEDSDCIAYLGYLKLLQMDHYNALKLINKSLELDPQNLDAMRYKFYFYLNKEDSEIKDNVVDGYFALCTDESDRFVKAGMLEYRIFHFAEARENFIQAFQLDPTNQYIQRRLEELNRRPLFFYQNKYRIRRWVNKKRGYIKTLLNVKWSLLKYGGVSKDTLSLVLIPIGFIAMIFFILLWL